MKNADKPAYPAKYKEEIFNGDEKIGTSTKNSSGLTKREELAGRNYARIISGIPFNELEQDDDWGIKVSAAKIAVAGADALLNELEDEVTNAD